MKAMYPILTAMFLAVFLSACTNVKPCCSSSAVNQLRDAIKKSEERIRSDIPKVPAKAVTPVVDQMSDVVTESEERLRDAIQKAPQCGRGPDGTCVSIGKLEKKVHAVQEDVKDIKMHIASVENQHEDILEKLDEIKEVATGMVATLRNFTKRQLDGKVPPIVVNFIVQPIVFEFTLAGFAGISFWSVKAIARSKLKFLIWPFKILLWPIRKILWSPVKHSMQKRNERESRRQSADIVQSLEPKMASIVQSVFDPNKEAIAQLVVQSLEPKMASIVQSVFDSNKEAIAQLVVQSIEEARAERFWQGMTGTSG